ncbi:MAG: hypothetical protein ACRDRU_26605 [Pseudonocardiaceae bacterium]
MSAARVGAPSGFALRVPESWLEFDVWRATRTGPVLPNVSQPQGSAFLQVKTLDLNASLRHDQSLESSLVHR